MRMEMLWSLAWLGFLCILMCIPRVSRPFGLRPPQRMFLHAGVPGAHRRTDTHSGHEGMISDGQSSQYWWA